MQYAASDGGAGRRAVLGHKLNYAERSWCLIINVIPAFLTYAGFARDRQNCAVPA